MSGALLEVAAEDGTPLRHRVWAQPDPRAYLIAWNGIMSHSGWLQPIAEPLVARGIALVGADRRGSGPNERARGDAPSAEVLIDDARRIVANHPHERTFFLGWCWGATLALNVIRESTARGLILVAPGLWPTKVVADRAKAADDAARGAREDEPVVGTPIDEAMFTRGPALAQFIEQDRERLTAVTPRFRKVMGRLAITAAAALRKVEVPVLLVLAEEDEATDSRAAEAAVVKALPKTPSIVRLPGPHGLMFERAPELAAAIASFVERQS